MATRITPEEYFKAQITPQATEPQIRYIYQPVYQEPQPQPINPLYFGLIILGIVACVAIVAIAYKK